jgi:hypothetical protein
MDSSYYRDIEETKDSFCLSGYSSESIDSKESSVVYVLVSVKKLTIHLHGKGVDKLGINLSAKNVIIKKNSPKYSLNE